LVIALLLFIDQPERSRSGDSVGLDLSRLLLVLPITKIKTISLEICLKPLFNHIQNNQGKAEHHGAQHNPWILGHDS
jgi:hypothetical protein